MAPNNSTKGGHISHAALITPILDGGRPTSIQIGHRIHAFRILTGRIGGFSDENIQEWLAGQGWDIEVALQYFRGRILMDARGDHQLNKPGRSTLQQQKDALLCAASYNRHQNHRYSIKILYEVIVDNYPGDQLSAMRCAYLLREVAFDMGAALENHRQRRKALANLAAIDRAERRLCMLQPGNNEPTMSHMDERLRDFLEIAGTDDWVSAKAFLKRHNWHMGNAIDTWMQQGLPVTNPTRNGSTGANREGYRPATEPHIETDNLWPAGRPLFAITPIDAADLADAALNYGNLPENPNQTSWYVDLDLEPAPQGIVRPDKLVQFCISRGQGIYRDLGPSVEEAGGRIEASRLNWMNSTHVTAINKIYNQNPHRRGGILKRPAALEYTNAELTWIKAWHQHRVDQYRNAHPGFILPPGKAWRDYVDFSKRELHADFNTHFIGTVVPGVSRPHSGRDFESLVRRRSRMRDLCNDFGIKYQPAH